MHDFSRAAALAVLLLVFFPGRAAAQDVTGGAAHAGSVVATGTGEVTLAPDRATIAITVRTVASEPDEAADRNRRTAAAVNEALASLDLSSDSIRSTGPRIGPNREYTPEGPRDAGYFAERGFRVTTEDLTDVARVVQAAIEAGATQIDHIAYSSSRENEARERALALAVDRARGDAQAIARAAGGRLGDVVLLSTENVSIPRPMMRLDAAPQAEMAQASMPEPEDLTITAFIQGRWAFEAVE